MFSPKEIPGVTISVIPRFTSFKPLSNEVPVEEVNITDIYSASACEWVDESGGPGWASCIAKDSNNTYYSLEIAFKKNNINLNIVK